MRRKEEEIKTFCKEDLFRHVQNKILTLRKQKLNFFINSKRTLLIDEEAQGNETKIKEKDPRFLKERISQIKDWLTTSNFEEINAIFLDLVKLSFQENILPSVNYLLKNGLIDEIQCICTHFLSSVKSIDQELLKNLILVCGNFSIDNQEFRTELISKTNLLEFTKELIDENINKTARSDLLWMIGNVIENVECTQEHKKLLMDICINIINEIPIENSDREILEVKSSIRILYFLLKKNSLQDLFVTGGIWNKIFASVLYISKIKKDNQEIHKIIGLICGIINELIGNEKYYFFVMLKKTNLLLVLGDIGNNYKNKEVVQKISEVIYNIAALDIGIIDELFEYDSIIHFLLEERGDKSDLALFCLANTSSKENMNTLVDGDITEVIYKNLQNKRSVVLTVSAYVALYNILSYLSSSEKALIKTIDDMEFLGLIETIQTDSFNECGCPNKSIQSNAQKVLDFIENFKEQMNSDLDESSSISSLSMN